MDAEVRSVVVLMVFNTIVGLVLLVAISIYKRRTEKREVLLYQSCSPPIFHRLKRKSLLTQLHEPKSRKKRR